MHWIGSVLGLILLWPSSGSWSTPLIALKEAENCGGCHKPGRSQRPFFARRCTLDCQGCHVDPSGGGPRNQWGTYYALDQASLLKMVAIDPLDDQSRFDLHYDGRVATMTQGDHQESFVMSSEVSLRLRPFVDYLHFTYQNLLLGRPGDKLMRVNNEGDRRFRERYSVMIDALPLNTYVKAYRGTPVYGLRRPNHSLWSRERIGLDQFMIQ